MGKTPARARHEYWDGANKWISIADIGKANVVISKTAEGISDKAVMESGIKLVPANTLIMSFKLSIGKTAITAEPMYTNEAIMAFLPKPNVEFDLHYLYHQFSNKDWSTGSNLAVIGLTLNKKSLQEHVILSPPLPTQRRIADELDQLCALKKNAEDRLAIFDQIVKSRFVEMFGDLKVNNKGWRIGSISDVATYWNGLTYKPEHVTEDGVIVLRSSNVQNGVIDLKDLVRVSLVAKEKNIVQAGDVLMCSRNGSAALVGKTAIIPKGLPKMYFGAFMMIVRGKYPEFLSSFFSTRYFRDQIACGKTSTVNQITCSMMNQVRLPIPPEELQREFAAFVAEVDKSKLTLRETVATLDQLYRAKLQEYFG